MPVGYDAGITLPPPPSPSSSAVSVTGSAIGRLGPIIGGSIAGAAISPCTMWHGRHSLGRPMRFGIMATSPPPSSLGGTYGGAICIAVWQNLARHACRRRTVHGRHRIDAFYGDDGSGLSARSACCCIERGGCPHPAGRGYRGGGLSYHRPRAGMFLVDNHLERLAIGRGDAFAPLYSRTGNDEAGTRRAATANPASRQDRHAIKPDTSIDEYPEIHPDADLRIRRWEVGHAFMATGSGDALRLQSSAIWPCAASFPTSSISEKSER